MKREFEDRVVSSALWAAAGDALGWISELTDSRGLRRRTRGKGLSRPVEWRRKIGGMSGPEVSLPAGTYSDDTQLRLAVGRAIRGDGVFDVEAFAKVELTVWPSFALGAGRGTKAAAANLQRRDVAWFSNFFSNLRGPVYIDAGGNGAAMRIQPHVWRHRGGAYLQDVIRDAIVTHGSMYGIFGAVFHAHCVAYALKKSRAPTPDDWRAFAGSAYAVEQAIIEDDQLRRFWLGAWESASGKRLRDALQEASAEMLCDIDRICAIPVDGKSTYERVVGELGGFTDRQGTGTSTALAAAYAAWLMESDDIETALIEVASTLGSDTDTIATMVGAILGATTSRLPDWEIQDKEYITAEALRLAKIANGEVPQSFPYPDLITWAPPLTQTDALGVSSRGVALAGLGDVEIISEAGSAGAFNWQWMRLHFGQTILCKRRNSELPKLERTQIGSARSKANERQPELLDNVALYQESINGTMSAFFTGNRQLSEASVEELTNLAIGSGFDREVLGNCLLQCLMHDDGLERTIAFAAIVAKAYSARRRAAEKRRR